jgi:hypothetical protein
LGLVNSSADLSGETDEMADLRSLLCWLVFDWNYGFALDRQAFLESKRKP